MQYIFCLIAITLFPDARVQENQFSWLTGSWALETRNGKMVESWNTESDSLLTGRSVIIRSDGTSALQETLRLERRKGEWYYISKVEGQNDNRPVSFHVTFIGREEFICENPEHDFPQRIAYRRIDNRMYASIEGRRDGKLRKRNFDFTKE